MKVWDKLSNRDEALVSLDVRDLAFLVHAVGIAQTRMKTGIGVALAARIRKELEEAERLLVDDVVPARGDGHAVG